MGLISTFVGALYRIADLQYLMFPGLTVLLDPGVKAYKAAYLNNYFGFKVGLVHPFDRVYAAYFMVCK